MSSKRTGIDDKERAPGYAGWRGELLAELALARLPGLIVNKRPDRPDIDFGYDFLVATEKGTCFFVDVEAFSSSRNRIADNGSDQEWRWHLDTELVRRAHESRSPFLLFLFDADTDQGRFLRLDTLPIPDRGDRTMTVRIPAKNIINKENLNELIVSLQNAQRS